MARTAIASLLFALSLALGCADGGGTSAARDGGGKADDGTPTGDAGASGDATQPPRASSETVALRLLHGANVATASDPMNALAYIPKGLRVGSSIDVVVHLHGFVNCIENVLGDADTACTAGGPVRSAHKLASQLEASGKNAILLLPEVTPAARDAASADFGALLDAGALAQLVDEALDDLAATLGTRPKIGRLIVEVHSGGYRGAAAFVDGGGARIDELYLLDALYGMEDSFESWLKKDLSLLQGTSPLRRYANVYTLSAGTLADSQAQATRLAAFAPADALLDDRTTATLTGADYAHGLIVKRSGLDHDGVVAYYVAHLLSTSQLDDK